MNQHTDLTIIPIETPTLGDRSYLVHDGEVAFVVDPQRDIDRVLALLDEHGVRLTHVFETHIHNDYVTGGLALAQRTGAQYLVNGEDDVSFSRTPVADGQVVEVGGRMRITALATPGHTFTHLSYLLSDGDEQVGVFSGGSLLYGATGRPDLLGHEHTHELVRHQHASAHRLADLLPDEAEVFPTHGFGSFCSATQSDATSSTIGREKRVQPGAHPGRADVRRGAAGRSRPVAGLLRPHGSGQRRRPLRARPLPARRGRRHRAPASHRGGRVGRRPTHPHRVRRRPRTRHAQLRTRRRLRHLPRLAHHLGHARHAARRECRGRRRGAARAGPHRHRPPGRPRHRQARGLVRPRAELVPDRHVRRPGPGATPPRGRRPRRTSRRRARQGPHRRRRQHAHPRAARPPRRRAGRRGLGALRRGLPRLGRRLVPRPPPVATLVAVDDSFDNAEKVGLHLVGPEA